MVNLRNGSYLGSNKKIWHVDGVFITETEYCSKVFEGWHSHENTHLSYIIQGGNREQRKSKEFESSPGDVVLYRSGELHRNFNTKHPSKNINVEIESRFFEIYNLDSPSDITLDITNAKFALLKAYHMCVTGDANLQLGIHSLLLSLLISAESQIDNPRWIGLVRDLLNDRWNENMSLNEIAHLVGVHPVTISKFFPRYFNYTLSQYVRRIRVERATSLIRGSNQSLTEIAHQCGFFDQSHFIRTFKQETGFSPNRFKKI